VALEVFKRGEPGVGAESRPGALDASPGPFCLWKTGTVGDLTGPESTLLCFRRGRIEGFVGLGAELVDDSVSRSVPEVKEELSSEYGAEW
jgi:hypothetical protein